MRSVVRSLVLLAALAGCGDDAPSGPTACEIGPEIVREVVANLLANQPDCKVDSDCVLLTPNVNCRGYMTWSGCGPMIHRAAAARWDADSVCDEIDDRSVFDGTACSVDGVCAQQGAPICIAGRCGEAE